MEDFFDFITDNVVPVLVVGALFGWFTCDTQVEITSNAKEATQKEETLKIPE